MEPKGFHRKLTAILSADVAGYSRLMQDDEAGTVKTLESYKQAFFDLIKQHRGWVVDSPGDNLLAEFASVVDAVQCAVAVQKEFHAHNAELPENRRMLFRIGVNLGDVIEEGERIYGDGVNIAARLESIADPGGICVSKTAFDQIESKLPLGYEFLGEQTVKNIAKPVGAYKVLMEPRVTTKGGLPDAQRTRTPKTLKTALVCLSALLVIVGAAAVWQFALHQAPPSQEKVDLRKVAFAPPDKTSLAVLPFQNMSDDPQQEYFSDGISEDLITGLSKISGLTVIARTSSFMYKGKLVNVQQIGEDLQVRYLLEGSVRKAGDQVRINAQLIDAANGQHIWAERYDGKIEDVFALQDKITNKIISALALKLTDREQKALTDKGTDNLLAYDEFLKGWQGYRLLTKEGFAEAKVHLERAVEIDPEFSRAYAALAALYFKAVELAAPGLRQGLGVTNLAELNAVRMKPLFLLKKALKKPTALAHGLMSQVYLYRYQHDEALSEIEQAVAMDPSDPELYAWMSNIFWFVGKTAEAIETAKMGWRLDPKNPAIYLIQQAKAYLPDGDLQESLQLLELAKSLNSDLAGSISLSQAMILANQGRDEEARIAYGAFVKSRIWPIRNLKALMPYFPFSDPQKMDKFAGDLIKAGVPGKPTDYYKILKHNRIDGEGIKQLLSGRKIKAISSWTGAQIIWEWATIGEWYTASTPRSCAWRPYGL